MNKSDCCTTCAFRFADELRFIEETLAKRPHFARASYFRSESINRIGYSTFRWKFDRDRVLYIRWENQHTTLSIRQKLSVPGIERPIMARVTWGDEPRELAFDSQGETRLEGNDAKRFWREALGNQMQTTLDTDEPP